MAERAGFYDEPTARMVLATVRELVRSGWELPGRTSPTPQYSPRPIRFKNDSGETIPPYSLIQITGTVEEEGRNLFLVDKYDEDVFGGFLFSGHREVKDKNYGIAQSGPCILAQAETGQTITTGHLWGPVAAQWYISPNGGPWAIQGEDDIADDVVWVTADVATSYVGIVTTKVTARSGTTLGSGVVTIKTIGDSHVTATQQTSIDVQSLVSSTIAVDTYVVMGRTTNGKLVVISEDCG